MNAFYITKLFKYCRGVEELKQAFIKYNHEEAARISLRFDVDGETRSVHSQHSVQHT